jgi:hypothetical protein
MLLIAKSILTCTKRGSITHIYDKSVVNDADRATEVERIRIGFEIEVDTKNNGAPGVIRTRDLLLRRQALYPAELRAHL